LFFGIGSSRIPPHYGKMFLARFNSNGDTVFTKEIDENMRETFYCKVKTNRTYYWISNVLVLRNQDAIAFSRYDSTGNRDKRVYVAGDSISDTFEQVLFSAFFETIR
jgi:hypothetical protein